MTAIALAPARSRAATLARRYAEVRAQTEALCVPLQVEDYVVSTMSDVSPTKWHLAHTSWFFETFVLAPFAPAYRSPNPRYAFLFNSYYVQAGERHCRAQRGLVTRPTVAEVYAYRAQVDDAMRALLDALDDETDSAALAIIELGLHHEQQHQELLLTDIKHVFWMNPLRPVYRPRAAERTTAQPARWVAFAEGVREIGHPSPTSERAPDGFTFDNETPRHRVFSDAFQLASRLVTNGEWLAFIAAGGYRRPEYWLSNGWATVQQARWEAPLYWERDAGGDMAGSWSEFTLAGMRPLALDEPACHLSYFEADAFARWAQRRLPTEAEWEIAATDTMAGTALGAVPNGSDASGFVEAERFHPAPAPSALGHAGALLEQLYGDVWQWTQSPYVAYPGYKPAAGAIGEYNGKWMCDQWVLRGASCATPRSHARATYRNFFPSDARWQFTGMRLADGAQ